MKSIRQSPQPGRAAGRAQRDQILDPYQAQQKLQGPTACPQAAQSTTVADGDGGRRRPMRTRTSARRAAALRTASRPAP